ncbi:hypothetical protein [Dyadobacter frigoris]|uniref:Uncharacterized protein n=1 Tax=Dyadobacter frigoris TaxID=2576211 RepID=A0A4U6DE63_9BACT|nr:hypothetical protein [Dyadobacter frigoris]TKT92774.1 hypothetical protein FDK13_08195 [Dyadobacter frigoris]GLU51675.1 hypothetical protein Dfri01_11360 [Dyadobacter frigoris]
MKNITTSNSIADILSSKAENLSLTEVLSQEISSLNGVTDEMKAALEAINIKTVFDLGTSWVFANARQLLLNSQAGGGFNRIGKIPGNFLDNSFPTDIPIEKIGDADIKYLVGVGIVPATAIETSLGIKTIKELAFWQPAEVARLIVASSMGTNLGSIEDTAEELRPKFGEYPTHRVYYDTLVMLEMKGTPQVDTPIIDIKSKGGTLSLKAAIDQKGRFAQPAIGTILTFSQSWYSQGITLGQMVHSLGLAPGEVTRVAVIDWNRKTTGKQTEAIDEREKLDNQTTHSLATQEVQEAVANEMQEGGSKSSSSSSSTSASASMSVETGLLTSLFASGGASGNVQTASTDASAESSSWSVGHRDIAASMSKNINDKTEQHSNSARSRRASVVKEVSQSEHEQVSTRVVANYNHMHALTIQYYEVIQIYRTLVQLHKAERCLFLPMEIIDFEDEIVLERYRSTLARRALNSTAFDLLIDDTSSVTLTPTIDSNSLFVFNPSVASSVATNPVHSNLMFIKSLNLNLSESDNAKIDAFKSDFGEKVTPSISNVSAMQKPIWQSDTIANISRLIGKSILRPNDNKSLHLSDNTFLIRVTVKDIVPLQINLHNIQTGDNLISVLNMPSVVMEKPILLSEIDSIQIEKTKDSKQREGTVILTCSCNGSVFDVPVPVTLGNDIGLNDVIKLNTDREDRKRKTIKHLKENADYYSKVIYQNLDSAALTILFSQYKWGDRTLLELVDPKPVKVVGNYLILKAPTDRIENLREFENQPTDIQEWLSLIDKYNIKVGETSNERLVPIPTGGVFAEAVLGRSNSAEKLDITRFWNWQDSPIPILPTDIAPIQTSTRGQAEDLKATPLSSPVLNIVNPTTLPTGSDLGSILSAVSNGNMFRDMSGLAGTQGLVKAGMEGTLQAATESGQLTSANMKTQAQKAVSMAQIAADLAKSIVSAATGVPAGGGSSVQGISGDGAKINHAKNMDDRGVKNNISSNTDNTKTPDNSSSQNNDSANQSFGSGSGTNAPQGAGSFETDAFNKTNWGGLGTSGNQFYDKASDTGLQLASTSNKISLTAVFSFLEVVCLKQITGGDSDTIEIIRNKVKIRVFDIKTGESKSFGSSGYIGKQTLMFDIGDLVELKETDSLPDILLKEFSITKEDITSGKKEILYNDNYKFNFTFLYLDDATIA